MFNRLRYALDPGKTRDPLEYLPLEMAEIVIKHLNMRDRMYVSLLDLSVQR
jgi:F-box/TPR repeat protein Pof3